MQARLAETVSTEDLSRYDWIMTASYLPPDKGAAGNLAT